MLKSWYNRLMMIFVVLRKNSFSHKSHIYTHIQLEGASRIHTCLSAYCIIKSKIQQKLNWACFKILSLKQWNIKIVNIYMLFLNTWLVKGEILNTQSLN